MEKRGRARRCGAVGPFVFALAILVLLFIPVAWLWPSASYDDPRLSSPTSAEVAASTGEWIRCVSALVVNNDQGGCVIRAPHILLAYGRPRGAELHRLRRRHVAPETTTHRIFLQSSALRVRPHPRPALHSVPTGVG